MKRLVRRGAVCALALSGLYACAMPLGVRMMMHARAAVRQAAVEPSAEGEVVAGRLDMNFAKAQTATGVLSDKYGRLVGTVQVKAGKVNKKRGTVNLSVSVTLLVDGKAKKVTARAVLTQAGGPDAQALARSMTLAFKAPIGATAFELAADGTFTLKNASYVMGDRMVGGALKGGARGTFRLEDFGLAVPGELQEDLLPYEVPFDVAGGKWRFAKFARVKWAKDKKTNEFGRVVDESSGKTNRASLKLTYTSKTGVFKGAFKVYALEETAGRKKLKKYTVKVLGLVVDGVGQGAASCKQPAVGSWPVTVE